MIKRLAAPVALAFALAGCSLAKPGGEPIDTPSASVPELAAPVPFDQKYVYPDQLEMEVTRAVAGHFTGEDVAPTDDTDLRGKAYVSFTVRLRNGSPKPVTLSATHTVTYGPDGIEAEPTYLLDDSELQGKLLPGKSRSADSTYLVPEKYWDDVILEVAPDLEHESAVFGGSVK